MALVEQDDLPLTERQIVTRMAALVDSDLWGVLGVWWRRMAVERMLNASAAAQAGIAAEYQAGLGLLSAISNYVTVNRGAVDGRTTRHKQQAAGIKPVGRRHARKAAAGGG